MDAISLLTPHTKCAIRPSSNDPSVIVSAIHNAYRICWYGRPGPSFVDLPADLIMDTHAISHQSNPNALIPSPPKPSADPSLIFAAASLLKSAAAPLVVIGKGAAYSRAEIPIRNLINGSHLPFLPTPMGKGVVPDSSPLNTSSARSAALKDADVVLLLGARLNWILHFGAPPKFRKDVKIIQVDISAEELGRTNGVGEPALSIFGDIGVTVDQLSRELKGWKAFPVPSLQKSPPNSYPGKLAVSAAKNEKKASNMALAKTPPGAPFTYQRAFNIIKETLDALSPPDDGDIVYVSEGANTMDISRSMFPLNHPRQKLDAGTYATMGVGMGYAIAAWAAYNMSGSEAGGLQKRKKIVAFEGDSAFGFSAMEIETMARQKMDVLIIVMNNSGLYHGDTTSSNEWVTMQEETTNAETRISEGEKKKGLRSTSLWYETRYEKLADMVGGRGYFIRDEAGLAKAVKEGYQEQEKVVVLNVIIEPGLGKSISFGWQQTKEKHSDGVANKSKL
jgi:2-hydroxyacyl-CoA lyase 1